MMGSWLHHYQHDTAGGGGQEVLMANHKRKRPKNQRAGCLFCKPWKGNGCKRIEPRRQVRRAAVSEREQRQVVA